MPRKPLFDRILERTDGRKPQTLKQLWEKWGELHGDSFVLDVKLLVRDGTMRISWTEKWADEALAKRGPLNGSPAAAYEALAKAQEQADGRS